MFFFGSFILKDNDVVILMAGYDEHKYLEYLGFEIEHRSIPLWIEKMNILYKVYPAYNTLLLYSKPNRENETIDVEN